MKLTTYADSTTMFADLAALLANEIRRALSDNETARVAVPGGTTPGPIFDALSAADLDWSRVRIMLTDERRVPADHDRSNERLIRERLLVGQAATAEFVRLVPDGDDTDAQVSELTSHLPLNILVLGMGADMHTASLFPGSPDLAAALEANAPPLMMVEASEGLEPRITLTAPVLSGAQSTHVVIIGDEKRAALDRAQSLTPSEAPIMTVLDQAHVHWAP